jgi:hypothetical protein
MLVAEFLVKGQTSLGSIVRVFGTVCRDARWQTPDLLGSVHMTGHYGTGTDHGAVPIVTAFKIIAPAPIQTPLPIWTGFPTRSCSSISLNGLIPMAANACGRPGRDGLRPRYREAGLALQCCPR